MIQPKLISGPKGLKILLLKNNNSSSTTILNLIKAGSDWENKKNNGIFHFIEHLYFKGTKNYPTAKILMEAIDNIGGAYNAFTSHEYTGYYIKVLPEYSFSALEILTDILLNPLFPEEEIEKEKKVIFEEIKLYQDSPASLIVDYGFQLTFGDQPAGWPILGTKETLSRIKREDILKIVKTHYSTRNTLIVISGKIVNEKKMIDFIFKNFAKYNSKNPPLKPKIKKPKEKYEEKIYPKDVDQGHLFLGFPLEGLLELKERKIPLQLISVILGEKSSSRLWLKIREELGAAYYIRSLFSDFTDRSLFFIHAGIDLTRLEFVLKNIVEEINKFKNEGPQLKELEVSKAVLKSSLFRDLEDSLEIAVFYARHFLLENKIVNLNEMSQMIDKTKIEDIKKELNDLFSFKKAKLAIILPKKFKKINFYKIIQNLV
jgi:predicted Zn-dependent peptidase